MKFLKIIAIILGVLILLAAGVLIYFTVREYRPADEEVIKAAGGEKRLQVGDSLSVLTFNTGYGGLDQSEDFFMDGGTHVQPNSKDQVEKNLAGLVQILKENPVDIYCLQEVDIDSKRTFHINEVEYYEQELGLSGMSALNYKCDFVPFPIPPIGEIESGILTMTDLQVSAAKRISLPNPFAWPVRTCNLKRCLLETRTPIEGTEKELVCFNLHLEAYDNGEGKIEQSRMLAKLLREEYEKGNYVLAGGDFNQTFDSITKYPIQNDEYWKPGTIGEEDIPEGFSFAIADNAPTCRLLNAPYTGSPETSQTYVLDGFIVSPNLEVEKISVVDEGFVYSDHQPVYLRVKLL